ncbi:MAG: cytochrome b/b6 domain-containing protein [Pseudomonadota bacterium]
MTAETRSVLVWDWPVRLFHWSIVLLIPVLWWTAEEGYMDWHRRCGLTMLGLVIFRLMWGIAGSWTARFWPMLRRVSGIPDYLGELRPGAHRPVFGHNPMGVLSVFAILLMLSLQVGTGLFTVDVDGLESGPLATMVSFKTGREFADFHELNFDLLSIFILLHIVAILTYRFWLKDHLIGPMIGGRRPETDFAPNTVVPNRFNPFLLVFSIIIAAGSVYAVMNAG